MKHFTRVKVVMVRFAALGVLLAGSLGVPFVAATANAAPALKQAPSAPASSTNTVTAPIASKNQKSSKWLAPWTVSLSASSQYLWPTQYSTLTARTNQDVGPTPYYLSIYDATSNTFVARCGSGTTCSVSVTQPNSTIHYYYAYVSYYPSTWPPSGIQASTSTNVNVIWKTAYTTLQVNPGTTSVGGSSTLTATTSEDVGPSPFYTSIYDTTTGTRIAVCGFGTTCSVATTQSVATTHRFIAYISSYSAAYPPTGIQSTSNPAFITWSNTGYRVSLTSSYLSYGHERVTATANVNVGSTPYWIQIFNQNTGARIAVCGFGATCSVDVGLISGYNNFVAFISSYDAALPPSNTQASSNTLNVWFTQIN